MTAVAADEVLRFDGVRVAHGRREVLRVDTLRVQRGEVLAVLGPNGAGKSTLLQVSALLLRPQAGAVRLFWESGGSRRRVALRRRTASVFSAGTLLDMSARANVETALRLHGIGGAERRRRATLWLEQLGVGHLAQTRPHTLSAGEAQRVALARAFAVEPELLLLDEPFASVDAETRGRLVGELRELLRARSTTALVATHDRGETLLLADRVAVLLSGRLVQEGPVAEVFARPRTAEVAAFLGYSVVPGAALAGGGSRCDTQSIACIPPDGTAVVPAATPRAVGARVVGLRAANGRAALLCELAGDPRTVVAVEVPVEDVASAPPTGAALCLRIDPRRVVWLGAGAVCSAGHPADIVGEGRA